MSDEGGSIQYAPNPIDGYAHGWVPGHGPVEKLSDLVGRRCKWIRPADGYKPRKRGSGMILSAEHHNHETTAAVLDDKGHFVIMIKAPHFKLDPPPANQTGAST